ncbi:Dyp-type peroxidase [Bradyrhizobium sp. AUGA SZCCT0177]|uniref:Dyp-type peroxidase n=1 Tax=Bradyrhizobium sp. AUGA SZCCT0177 TaxID=2807665 RepID=UPI001BA4CE02|nr:Dyp-type peroxidase [Bradyrhizobium sp. AUGA SZCCT0177]
MELDLREIQGNVLAGFNTNMQVLIGLSVDAGRASDAAAWLAGLAPSVTSMADIREERGIMKAQLTGGTGERVWLGIGIGSDFLAQIREDLFFFDAGFTLGFRKRARPVLGDRTDQNAWRVGSPDNPLDVLLIFGSNNEGAADGRADELLAQAAAAGLRNSYRETARRIDDLEHFGFRDGVSQPLVRGIDTGGVIDAGNFVFGYARKAGENPYLPGGDPKGYLRNGSFLVFRRLAQDVGAFRDFCHRKAKALAQHFPGLTAAHLEALIVGRWPKGALTLIGVTTDPGQRPNDNAFDFPSDPLWAECPLGAHIRKVNPRSGPKDVVDVPRILRRGIPFGPPFDSDPPAERGLAFISYQTSIQEQLEFLTSAWMNSPAAPAGSAGHDLLVGRNNGPRSMPIAFPSGTVELSDDGQQWITPTGGGYLFAPGKTTLGRLTEPVAAGVGWRASKLLSKASIFVNSTLGIGGLKP